MSDLISREALKKAIEQAFETADLSEYEACICVSEIYDKEIDNAPTVELEKAKESEIIKAYTKGFYGCKHFGEIMGYWGFGGNDNEFCSDAEQKGGAV